MMHSFLFSRLRDKRGLRGQVNPDEDPGADGYWHLQHTAAGEALSSSLLRGYTVRSQLRPGSEVAERALII